MTKKMTIVVGTDFSPLARVAFDAACRLAHRWGAQVHVIHVMDRFTGFLEPYPVAEEIESRRRRRVEEHLAEFDLEDVEVTYEARIGVAARDLVRVAEERDAELIVVATHGYGPVGRAVLGSVAAYVIRAAPVPVLVVGQDRPAGDFEEVIAAVDLSGVSARVVELARRYSTRKVSVVHTYEPLPTWSYVDIPMSNTPEEAEALRQHRLERLAEIAGDDGELVKGPAAAVILDKAEKEEADLVVVGTSGHNAWERTFLGSTATRIMAAACCPVLVVPSTPS